MGKLQSFKIKSYDLNKFSQTLHNHDCPQIWRNISIPREFTFCFRYKEKYKSPSDFWSSLFIGRKDSEDEKSRTGLFFGYWDYVPWLGMYRPTTEAADWVLPGKEFDFVMLTWRHICISINLEEGSSVMFENGVLAGEKQFDGYVTFKEEVPDFEATVICVGCNFDWDQATHPGVVTDFQLFGRALNSEELEKWTGCQERLQGDIVNWDAEDWIFNQTGNGSKIEFLDFEKDVCDMRNMSYHFFPVKRTFKKSTEFCERLSGKLNE